MSCSARIARWRPAPRAWSSTGSTWQATARHAVWIGAGRRPRFETVAGAAGPAALARQPPETCGLSGRRGIAAGDFEPGASEAARWRHCTSPSHLRAVAPRRPAGCDAPRWSRRHDRLRRPSQPARLCAGRPGRIRRHVASSSTGEMLDRARQAALDAAPGAQIRSRPAGPVGRLRRFRRSETMTAPRWRLERAKSCSSMIRATTARPAQIGAPALPGPPVPVLALARRRGLVRGAGPGHFGVEAAPAPPVPARPGRNAPAPAFPSRAAPRRPATRRPSVIWILEAGARTGAARAVGRHHSGRPVPVGRRGATAGY